MSKTKTNIINADILNSKINVENYNNVYDINTPVFNYLNSIPNSCGKLMSFNEFKNPLLTFRKYFDNRYIDYYSSSNKLEDSEGNYVILDNPKTVVDSSIDVPDNFIDITRHYYITSNGLYNISGKKLYSFDVENNKANVYEFKEQKTGYVRYYSKFYNRLVFFDEVNNNYKVVDDNAPSDIFYDEDTDQLFSFKGTVFTIYDNAGNVSTSNYTFPTVDVALGALNIKDATISPVFEKWGKTYTLTLNWKSDNIYTTSSFTTIKLLTDPELVWENDAYTIKFNYKQFDITNTYSDSGIVSGTSSKGILIDDMYYYLQKPNTLPKTNEFYHSCFDENNNELFGYLGVKDTKGNILLSYKNYRGWNVYKFDGQYIISFNSDLILPLGFVDTIYEIYGDNITYLSSLDQKIHRIRFQTPTVEELFNLNTLTYLPYDSNFVLDPFEDVLEHYLGRSTKTLSNWFYNAKLESSYFVLGNHCNYLKQLNNITLSTDQEYYFPYTSLKGKNIFNSTFGEVYFYNTTPTEEYSVIPLAYQNETSLELDLEIERDVSSRMPIPLGAYLKQLTPNNWVFTYQDTVFNASQFGGVLINAFDVTDIKASTDTLDNIISLRGSLYTIKNNSIYSVNEDFTLGAYLTSIGRMEYVCNNDSLILFYDKALKRLVSFDASNSWSVYLNIPLLEILKGVISNQNEIVLFCSTGVLIQHNDTMTFIKCKPSYLSSSNGANFSIGSSIYSPGKGSNLELESSWLGMTNCRQMMCLDTIYLELEPEDTTLTLEFNIEMLVDKEIKAGEFRYNIKDIGNLKYIRIQPTCQKCNAFKYTLKTNGSIKRISYSITQDVEELQTITADVVKEIRL